MDAMASAREASQTLRAAASETPHHTASEALHDLALEVRRGDIQMVRVHDRALPRLSSGEALFEVERFGLTANNVTYALLGERLGYWKVFPAVDGWGHIPVWAHLRVLDSGTSGLEVGRRAYGLSPMSSRVILAPDRVTDAGFVDATPHRSTLEPVYNSYSWLDDDAASDLLLVLRPVFWLSFMLDDYLAEHDLLAGRTVVISSASSKVAIGGAHLLRERGVPVVGLTSPANIGFVAGLGLYDQVLEYGRIAELQRVPAVLIDIAGSGPVRAGVERRLGPLLARAVIAGATHGEADGMQTASQDERTEFLFVPERMRRRAKDIGWNELAHSYGSALARFARHAAGWLRITSSSGPADVEIAYRRTLANQTAPDEAVVLALAAHRR
jgi:hypothetical protein